MADTTLVGLVQNAALLLALVVVFEVSGMHWPTGKASPRQVPLGMLVGAIGMAVMLSPWVFVPGIIFDTRSVLLCISGLFFGLVPTAVAVLMTAALRFYQGGAATLTGISVIVASGLIGLAWRHLRRGPLQDATWAELYGMGIVVHLVMLALMLLLPWETAKGVLSSISLPVMLIYPLGTALLGRLMANRLRRDQARLDLQASEVSYRSIFENASDGLLAVDPAGAIQQVNQSTCDLLGYPAEALEALSFEYLLASDDPQECQLALAAVLGTEKNLSQQTFRHSDGSSLTLEVNSRLVPEGGWMVGLRDLRARLRYEADRQRNEARLNSLVRILQYHAESTQDLLDHALEEAIQITGSRIGYIYTYHEERRQFELNSWSRDVMQECTVADPQSCYDLDQTGIWGEAVRQGRPILMNDFQAEHPLKKGIPEGHAALRKYLTVPIKSEGRIVAVVGVANKADDYDEGDVLQLSLLMDAVWKMAERQRAEESLRRYEWMLSVSREEAAAGASAPQAYGDLAALNTCRVILDAVGPELLASIAQDYVSMLETSAAIYEQNGDYAYGIFSSGWCRFMDQASRDLCGTEDNRQALAGGCWLCHDSCWKAASLAAMEAGAATDIACAGGLHLYAEPVWAAGRVVGAINFGYGDPPRDQARLLELADKYQVAPAELEKQALAYETRPPFIIDLAKRRLHASAHLIGEIVERAQAEERARAAQEELARELENADRSRTALLSLIEDQKIAEAQVRQLNAGLEERIRQVTLAEEAASTAREELARQLEISDRSGRTLLSVVEDQRLAQAELQVAMQRLQSLHEIDSAILQVRAPDQIARTALRSLRKAIHCQASLVLLVDPVAKSASFFSVDSEGKISLIPGEMVPPEEFTALQRMRDGKVVYHEDLSIVKHLPYTCQRLLEEGMRSSARFPLIVHKELTGVLVTASHQPGAFSQQDLQIAAEVATQLAVALYNARLLEEIQRYSTELEQRVQLRTLELQDLVNFREQIMASSNTGLVVYNESGQCILANPAAAQIVGASVEEVLQQNYHRLDSWKKSGLLETAEKALQTGEETSLDSHLMSSFGRESWLHTRFKPFLFSGKTHLLLTIHDQTDVMRAQQKLSESARYTRSLIEANPDPLLVMDTAGRVSDSNQAAEKVTTLKRNKLVGQPFASLFNDPLKALQGYEQALKDGFVFDYPLTFRAAGGDLTEVLCNASVFRNEKGEVQGVFAALRDMSTVIRVEQELRQSQQQLQAANQELEAFSYSVSHDLRAPLRALDGFSQALAVEYPDKLDEQGRHYLERITSASHKMGRLITDMLNLSRVTRQELNLQRVDLSALASQIAREIQEQQPERKVEWVIGKRYNVLADSHLLSIALENLLGNAWKFSSQNPHARIELGMEQQENGKVYFIRDNGVGFDMAYAGKLFGAFQRLHGEDEFSGTGVGLATVQRIIRRHGGWIRPQSAPGQGATFYFNLGENE